MNEDNRKPTYLLEFPDMEFKKELKTASAMASLSMKDFIIRAVENEIKRTKDLIWLSS